jgi:hypothetical protein
MAFRANCRSGRRAFNRPLCASPFPHLFRTAAANPTVEGRLGRKERPRTHARAERGQARHTVLRVRHRDIRQPGAPVTPPVTAPVTSGHHRVPRCGAGRVALVTWAGGVGAEVVPVGPRPGTGPGCRIALNPGRAASSRSGAGSGHVGRPVDASGPGWAPARAGPRAGPLARPGRR